MSHNSHEPGGGASPSSGGGGFSGPVVTSRAGHPQEPEGWSATLCGGSTTGRFIQRFHGNANDITDAFTCRLKFSRHCVWIQQATLNVIGPCVLWVES